jgi:hypothetical protein
MFKGVIKQLKQLEYTGIAVPVNADSEGYLDKECPDKNCLFQFKFFGEDWTNLCKDEVIHCPQCGHQAPSKSWWTTEQIESAKKQAMAQVSSAFSKGLAEGARDFNRRQRPGFITMSLKVSGSPKNHVIVPIEAQEEMKLKIQCESCSTRFSVIGSAFFCPCCGFNSVERIFDDSLKKVETKLNNIQTIRSAIEASSGKDTAELTCRSLIETGLNDCVVAFQKLIEELYKQTVSTVKLPINVFQRIEDGSNLWRNAIGKGYEDWVSKDVLAEMNILFHKRHLLAHTEGFVDDRYVIKSGDRSYSVGQRIVVREKDVRRLIEIVKILTTEAKKYSLEYGQRSENGK